MKYLFITLGILFICGCGRYAGNVDTTVSLFPPTLAPPPPEALADAMVASELRREAAASAEQKAPAKTAIASLVESPCAGVDASDFDCYETWFTKVVNEQGIPHAFTVLKEHYGNNDYIRSQCHPITHVIGNAAGAKFDSASQAYTQGDSFCWSGYYHGVMEGIIGRVGRANLPARMDEFCADLSAQRRYSFDHYNCVHGLGHGVMATNGNELFDSLKVCDALTDTWDRSSCWSGAFM
ncbi:MAG: hypothetical protein Q7S89_02655, partial [bacterium]|nr:hypothetical protein [bacterium]